MVDVPASKPAFVLMRTNRNGFGGGLPRALEPDADDGKGSVMKEAAKWSGRFEPTPPSRAGTVPHQEPTPAVPIKRMSVRFN
jgi:hypothetical protein